MSSSTLSPRPTTCRVTVREVSLRLLVDVYVHRVYVVVDLAAVSVDAYECACICVHVWWWGYSFECA